MPPLSRSTPSTPSGARGSPVVRSSAGAPPAPPVDEFNRRTPIAAKQRLRMLIRRHLDKVKSRRTRSPRASRTADRHSDGGETDEEGGAHHPRKYERLERAVRRQLSKGRAARRKLNDLRKKIESTKNRARERRSARRRDRNAKSPRGGGGGDGYASDGGISPRANAATFKSKLGAPAPPAAVMMTPTKDLEAEYARERAPSGEMTPLEDDEEEEEEEEEDDTTDDDDDDELYDDDYSNAALVCFPAPSYSL